MFPNLERCSPAKPVNAACSRSKRESAQAQADRFIYRRVVLPELRKCCHVGWRVDLERCPGNPVIVLNPVVSTSISARIDALFAPYDKPHMPGLYIGIVQDSELIHLKGYGRAEIDHDIEWGPGVRTRIASISKQMVALLLVELARDGFIDLGEPLGNMLPELPSFARDATVDDCLLHVTGIRNDEPVADLAGHTQGAEVTLDSLYRLACRQRTPQRGLGQAFDYNDAAYRLVVRWIERRLGRPIGELLAERLFVPLGMDSAAMTYDEHQLLANDASMYEVTDQGFNHSFWGRSSSGDGGISMNFDDLLRWYRGVLTNMSRIAPLLAPSRRTPDVAPFARRGLFRGVHRNRSWIGHAGLGGCGIFHFPEDDLGILFFGNRSDLRRHTLPFRVYDAVRPECIDSAPPAISLGLEQDVAGGAALQTFVDCDTGDIVRIAQGRHGLLLRHFAQNAYLGRAADGIFETVDGTTSARVKQLASGWEVDLGFGRWQHFIAASALYPTISVPAGLFASEEVGALLRVEPISDSDDILVRFAEGPSPTLNRVLARVAPRTWSDGEFAALHLPAIRENGACPELLVHCNTARNIRYARIGENGERRIDSFPR
ncbi:hypothetical protein CLG96_07730 [Sphingomonas oleivorans]|uniref:Beta-lactamase-related domain-containing protein n=1 Tax=Sphingomonas oleivorans TaxID=1735121 RepID=A0A2T5FYZ9_9SPHN|nr:serine hydrolase domain-containing protein [Sphingomonas oleivorans]PTQ11808.1 hypothetical protein CLG96_07730 [Sphingomonas oleivorans]